MSHKLKYTHIHEVTKLAEQVTLLSEEELYTLYGIDIRHDDHTHKTYVHDLIDEIVYGSILEWAESQISVMYDPKFEKRHTIRNSDG